MTGNDTMRGMLSFTKMIYFPVIGAVACCCV
jgi:hypothetical protein